MLRVLQNTLIPVANREAYFNTTTTQLLAFHTCRHRDTLCPTATPRGRLRATSDSKPTFSDNGGPSELGVPPSPPVNAAEAHPPALLFRYQRLGRELGSRRARAPLGRPQPRRRRRQHRPSPPAPRSAAPPRGGTARPAPPAHPPRRGRRSRRGAQPCFSATPGVAARGQEVGVHPPSLPRPLRPLPSRCEGHSFALAPPRPEGAALTLGKVPSRRGLLGWSKCPRSSIR